MKRHKRLLSVLAVVLIAIGIIAYSLRPYYLNIAFGISDYFRDRGLRTPEDVVRVDDISYGPDSFQVMDVYYPAGTSQPLPTIVSIHGGGYTYGSKETYQFYCMSLCQRGFTVVNFSYRLGPGNKYPSQIQDTNAVLSLIVERAEEFYIDPDNIFFVGDSAGGHLNAQYSAAVSNPDYASLLGLEIPDFQLRATALNCGVYEKEDAFSGHMAQVLEGKLSDYEKELDINGHMTEDFPPSFVMSSTGDLCLPYAEPMYEKIRSLGVEAELHIYGDEKKHLPHVFHIDIQNPDARVCNDDECAFFARHVV